MDLLKAYAAEALDTSVEDIRATYDFGDYLVVVTQDGKKHPLEPQVDRPEPPLIRWRVTDPEGLIKDATWEVLNQKYEHVDAVHDADDDEILELAGIGPKILKNIRRLIGPNPLTDPNLEPANAPGVGALIPPVEPTGDGDGEPQVEPDGDAGDSGGE